MSINVTRAFTSRRARALATALLLTVLYLAHNLLAPSVVSAKDIFVGDGTPQNCTEQVLRNALAAAANGDIIYFNCGPNPVTITLTSPLVIDKNVTVTVYKSQVTLSGGGTTQLIQVPLGVSVNIHSIALANGKATQGGAIYNAGELFTNQVTFLNNSAGDGGAIFNAGLAQSTGDSFIGNSATNTAGAIFNAPSALFTCNILDFGTANMN